MRHPFTAYRVAILLGIFVLAVAMFSFHSHNDTANPTTKAHCGVCQIAGQFHASPSLSQSPAPPSFAESGSVTTVIFTPSTHHFDFSNSPRAPPAI